MPQPPASDPAQLPTDPAPGESVRPATVIPAAPSVDPDALLAALPEHATGDRLPTVSEIFQKEGAE